MKRAPVTSALPPMPCAHGCGRESTRVIDAKAGLGKCETCHARDLAEAWGHVTRVFDSVAPPA